jgi:hypothetical protein
MTTLTSEFSSVSRFVEEGSITYEGYSGQLSLQSFSILVVKILVVKILVVKILVVKILASQMGSVLWLYILISFDLPVSSILSMRAHVASCITVFLKGLPLLAGHQVTMSISGGDATKLSQHTQSRSSSSEL